MAKLILISCNHHEDKIFPMLSEDEKQSNASKEKRRAEMQANIDKAVTAGNGGMAEFWKEILQEDKERYG